MSTSPDPQAGLREDQSTVPSGQNGSLVKSPIAGTVLGDRYRVVEAIDPEGLAADDLALHRRVVVRTAMLADRPGTEGWRERVLQLASARHPNFLNIMDWVLDASIDFVITECARGRSVAELLKEHPALGFKEVLQLLRPLGGALDLTAAFTCHPNSLSTRGLFVEAEDPNHDPADLKAVSDGPRYRIRIDAWELVKPSEDVAKPLVTALEKGASRGLAVQQAALLAYELLGGEKVQQDEIKGSFKPVPRLTDAANSILYGCLQGWPLFDSSESFLQALESANKVTEAKELELSDEVQPWVELATYPGSSVSRTSRRRRPVSRAVAVSMLTATTLGFVGMASTFLLWDHHPKAARVKSEMTQSGVVSLASEPTGATVRLDGSEFGHTPIVRRPLPPGTHQLTVSLPSFQERDLQVEVSPGEGEDLGNIGLRQIGGELVLKADLPGTAYEVMGAGEKRFTGVTPAKLEQLDPGSYTVRLHPEGWPEYEERVEVSAGQSISVDHPFAVNSSPETPTASDASGPASDNSSGPASDTASSGPASDTASTEETEPSNVVVDRMRASFTRAPFESHERLATQHKAPLTKTETLKRFDAEWDGKETAIQRQILSIDKRIAVASGEKRDHLKAWKKYLGQKKHYVRELRRYNEYALRREWNERHGTVTIFDTLRDALGI